VLEHPQDQGQVLVVMADTEEELEAMVATKTWNSVSSSRNCKLHFYKEIKYPLYIINIS
jgi:hypothetical protein